MFPLGLVDRFFNWSPQFVFAPLLHGFDAPGLGFLDGGWFGEGVESYVEAYEDEGESSDGFIQPGEG